MKMQILLSIVPHCVCVCMASAILSLLHTSRPMHLYFCICEEDTQGFPLYVNVERVIPKPLTNLVVGKRVQEI